MPCSTVAHITPEAERKYSVLDIPALRSTPPQSSNRCVLRCNYLMVQNALHC